LSHPFQLPRTPTAQRLAMTTLGLFRSCYAEQYLCETGIFLLVLSRYIGDPDVIDHFCGLV
jgi:hypothetical protein